MSRPILILQIVLSIGVMGGILANIGIHPLLGAVNTIQLDHLFWGALFAVVSLLLSGLSVWVLFRRPTAPLPMIGFLAAFFGASGLAAWLPGRVGDLSLAALLNDRYPIHDSIALIVVDKLITLAVMILAGSFSLAYFFHQPALVPMLVALSLSASICSWRLVSSARDSNLLATRLPARIVSSLRLGLDCARGLIREHPNRLGWNVVITVGRLVTTGLSAMHFFAAANQSVSFIASTLAVSAVQLLSLIPISIQGIGINESAYIILLGGQGITSTAIVLACFAGRTINLISTYILSILFSSVHLVRTSAIKV